MTGLPAIADESPPAADLRLVPAALACWVGGLDRIHHARGILTCYDFSATPFAPSGKQSSDEASFDWIVHNGNEPVIQDAFEDL